MGGICAVNHHANQRTGRAGPTVARDGSIDAGDTQGSQRRKRLPGRRGTPASGAARVLRGFPNRPEGHSRHLGLVTLELTEALRNRADRRAATPHESALTTKATATDLDHRAQRKPILWWPAVARRETDAPRQLARNVSGPVSAAPPRVTRSATLSRSSRPSS